jgi:hypothetical protein
VHFLPLERSGTVLLEIIIVNNVDRGGLGYGKERILIALNNEGTLLRMDIL